MDEKEIEALIESDKIARGLLKYSGEHNGVRISLADVRQLGNVANEIGVPLNSLLNFTRPMLHEIVDELYSPKK